jgi:hypothetical protein
VKNSLIDVLIEIVVKLVLAAVLMVVLMVGFALFGHHVAWWAAALISVVCVFGGVLILDDDHDWFS